MLKRFWKVSLQIRQAQQGLLGYSDDVLNAVIEEPARPVLGWLLDQDSGCRKQGLFIDPRWCFIVHFLHHPLVAYRFVMMLIRSNLPLVKAMAMSPSQTHMTPPSNHGEAKSSSRLRRDAGMVESLVPGVEKKKVRTKRQRRQIYIYILYMVFK